VAHSWHGAEYAVQSTARVAGARIIDRHMDGKVVRIDAQFIQLVGGNQQVQRQLLIAQIEANYLRQKTGGTIRQRELYGALGVVRVVQTVDLLASMLGKQLSVHNHVVVFR